MFDLSTNRIEVGCFRGFKAVYWCCLSTSHGCHHAQRLPEVVCQLAMLVSDLRPPFCMTFPFLMADFRRRCHHSRGPAGMDSAPPISSRQHNRRIQGNALECFMDSIHTQVGTWIGLGKPQEYPVTSYQNRQSSHGFEHHN